MPKSTRQRAHPEGTNARNAMVRQPAIGIARSAAPDLSRDARRRLAMLDWHRAHGANVSRTARHFGYSRPTVYRWPGRFERLHLETLEDRGSAPRRRRRPTWTLDQLTAVKAVRLSSLGQGQARGSSSGGRGSCSRPRWSAGSSRGCADRVSCMSRAAAA